MFEKVLAKLEALEPLIKATGDENIQALSSFLYEGLHILTHILYSWEKPAVANLP